MVVSIIYYVHLHLGNDPIWLNAYFFKWVGVGKTTNLQCLKWGKSWGLEIPKDFSVALGSPQHHGSVQEGFYFVTPKMRRNWWYYQVDMKWSWHIIDLMYIFLVERDRSEISHEFIIMNWFFSAFIRRSVSEMISFHCFRSTLVSWSSSSSLPTCIAMVDGSCHSRLFETPSNWVQLSRFEPTSWGNLCQWQMPPRTLKLRDSEWKFQVWCFASTSASHVQI